MKLIDIKELVENLNNYQNRIIALVLEGNIEQKIDMEFVEANIDRDYIEIVYDKSRQYALGKSIKIYIYQIKKIESDEGVDFFIYLDGEQKVMIFTEPMDFFNYKISKFEKI